jgi:hypothetical protein
MIPAAVILVLALLVGTVVIAGTLRQVVRDQVAVERRLHAPNTHTISYAVPNGVDPGDFRGALLSSGFESLVTTIDTRECLLVGCEEKDRARLRHLIEAAPESAYDGSQLDLHPVVFEDER